MSHYIVYSFAFYSVILNYLINSSFISLYKPHLWCHVNASYNKIKQRLNDNRKKILNFKCAEQIHLNRYA